MILYGGIIPGESHSFTTVVDPNSAPFLALLCRVRAYLGRHPTLLSKLRTTLLRLISSSVGLRRRKPPEAEGEGWCDREDSNFHASRRYHLKVVRLPIPPRSLLKSGWDSKRRQGVQQGIWGFDDRYSMIDERWAGIASTCRHIAAFRSSPEAAGRSGGIGRLGEYHILELIEADIGEDHFEGGVVGA